MGTFWLLGGGCIEVDGRGWCTRFWMIGMVNVVVYGSGVVV